MDERLKNMVFINICESCYVHYTKNNTLSNFQIWCNYHKNYICGNISGKNIPKEIINLEFEIIKYLDEIYGFSDDEALTLIYEFFKENKWEELYEIARYTLYLQQHPYL